MLSEFVHSRRISELHCPVRWFDVSIGISVAREIHNTVLHKATMEVQATRDGSDSVAESTVTETSELAPRSTSRPAKDHCDAAPLARSRMKPLPAARPKAGCRRSEAKRLGQAPLLRNASSSNETQDQRPRDTLKSSRSCSSQTANPLHCFGTAAYHLVNYRSAKLAGRSGLETPLTKRVQSCLVEDGVAGALFHSD
jgi:hypothetical protein